jgi:integrase
METTHEGVEIVQAEIVEPLARRDEQLRQFQLIVGGAVDQALDERDKREADERSKTEATPESRARAWSVTPENTRVGYLRDFARFVEWCAERGERVGTPLKPKDDADAIERASEIEAAFAPATAALVVSYVLDMDKRGKAITTIGRAAAAIGAIHYRFGHKKPTRSERVRDELSYLRKKQKHQPKRAKALELEHVLQVMALFEPRDTLHKLRNAALFATWINFGLRRVEIHKLRREHVSIEWSKKLKERALTLTIHESKTDQEAKGATLAVGGREARSLCALRAVEDWLAATDEQQKGDSPLFPKMRGEVVYPAPMSLRTLDLLVKRVAKKADLEGSFSTHSLRAGCATSLYSLGVEESAISRHLRHKSVTVTRIYDRPSNQLGRDPFRGKL